MEIKRCENCRRKIPDSHIRKHPNARFCPKSIYPDSDCKNRFWSRGQRRSSKNEKRIEALERGLSQLSGAINLFIKTSRLEANLFKDMPFQLREYIRYRAGKGD